MKQGSPLPVVLAELKRQAAAKHDYISPAPSIRLEEDGSTITVGSDAFGTTPLFHRQLGAALGIPAKYYDLCREQKPTLLALNTNTWLADRAQSSYMVRTLDDCARALLSDRYRRIDNLEIAMAVLPLFMGSEDYEVVSSNVSPNHLHIKISYRNKRYEIKPGDWVEFGCIVSNSEVGLGAVTIRPFLTRLICTNGCVVNDFGERKHHVGRQVKAVEDSYELFSDSTKKLEDDAFLAKIRDVALATLDESRYPLIVGKLQDAANVPITGRVQSVVELTSRQFGFTQPEQDSILDYLIRGGDMTLYGLSNAVTRASQDIDNYDRATEMESIGWDIVSLDPADWKIINNT